MGIAYALNAGLKRAGESGKFAWILTLDQDSKFISIDDFVNKAFKCIELHSKVGIVAPAFSGFSSLYEIRPGLRKAGSVMDFW